MSEYAGRVVARVDDRPPDPDRGYPRDDMVVIHFTDGSALEVQGSSYEEVSQSCALLSPADVRRRAQVAAGRREEKRLERLQRDEWRAISCDERAARNAAKPSDPLRDAIESLWINTSMLTLGERKVRERCPRCRERFCENAPVRVIPADPGYAPAFSWQHFTIDVKPSAKPSA